MTEREALAGAARAAGLRLYADDLEALARAWTRYRALMAALEEALDESPSGDGLPG